MKAFGIVGLLFALLYVAYLSTEQSGEIIAQKEQAEEKVDEAQQKIEQAMQKQMDRLNEQQ